MATKIVEIPEIGDVKLIKRRGNRTMRLSYERDGSVRVSLPYWLPYQAGLEFARSKSDWIIKHRPATKPVLQAGDRIGKAHRLQFSPGATTKPTVRLKGQVITVTYPSEILPTHVSVQDAAERGALRALKNEADALLPDRLKLLAAEHTFRYKSVSTKRLSSRWGSCSQHKEIVLNIYLMQLPWHLIDYVLVHELVHTEHLNHSASFWDRFEHALPGAKKLRRELKQYHTRITPTNQ